MPVYEKIICDICGREFRPQSGNTKYCSQPCRDKAQKMYDKKSYDKKKRNHMTKRKRKPTGKTVKCIVCGKEFVRTGNQKCCSVECSQKRKKERARKKYLQKKANQEQIKMGNFKNCIVCGKPFVPDGRRTLCCSEKCSQQHDKEYQREYYKRKKAEQEKASKATEILLDIQNENKEEQTFRPLADAMCEVIKNHPYYLTAPDEPKENHFSLDEKYSQVLVGAIMGFLSMSLSENVDFGDITTITSRVDMIDDVIVLLTKICDQISPGLLKEILNSLETEI